jgi:signal peptidase I
LAAIILMAAIGTWAIGTERVSYVVTNGISMQPLYHAGDLVVVVKADSYETGQIAAYHGARGLKVLHRIVGGDPDSGFIFKGDNNPNNDRQRPTADQMIGRAVLHIPQGGTWLRPMFSPSMLGMLGFLVFGQVAAKRSRREIARGRRKKKVKAMSRQGGPRAMAVAVVVAVKRLSPVMRAIALAAAAMAVTGVLLAVLGWMKPLRETHRADAARAPSISFSYEANVPSSPAYDGTKVHAPDPIFRKLTNKVDVRIQYRGDPGALDVSLKMTAPNGWHTTRQLLAPQRFTGRSYTATVTLDLNELQERSDAASKAIGVTEETVTLIVTARVTASGVTTFSAPLTFGLAPAVLAPPSTNALQAIGPVPRPTISFREIGLFGFTIMNAATARSWAVLLLLLTLAVAGLVYFLARQAAPARTRAEIERLYPQLLVHVEPMPSPPGKPVVNVDNFRALAKLAERYGQMILTWRRPDADDFVVRDEGITYRYRVPLDEPTLQNVELINRPNGAGSHRRKASSPSQVS